MSELMHALRGSVLFRAAFFVPSVIILIFSGFNLTAAPDPARVAAAMQVGIVNLDEGQTFPPINVADRLMTGLRQQFPFQQQSYASQEAAEAALDAGDIVAYIVIPPEFSKQAFGSDPVYLTVVGAGNATMAEANITRQLPTMLQTGISAAVNGLRLAMAKGQIPSGEMPVTLDAQIIHEPANPAASLAGFAASYTIWLSTAVGGLLLFISTRSSRITRPLSVVRTLVPVIASGVAMLFLATVLNITSGLETSFTGFWLTTWGIALTLAWFFSGLFSSFGFYGLILALPVVFYQGAIGGTQIPSSAAADWLNGLTFGLPFDHLGAVLRSMILGGSTTPDWMVFAATAIVGLILIWGGTWVWTRNGGTVDG